MNLNITGFGEEKSDMNYAGFSDWFFDYFPLEHYWKAHKSYVLCEVIFLLGGGIIFIHALKQGGRWPWLFFASMFHGFFVECMAFFCPFIENFWHARGIFTFLDRRMAIYIVFLCKYLALVHLSMYSNLLTYIDPVFYYHSSWAMSKLKLKNPLAEHLAVGLMTVLIDMPYDIIGIKYIHWIWHDTDPNIYDRHYWVPWNSYYFHSCFSASFQFFFHSTRNFFDKRNIDKWEAGSLNSEVASLIVSTFMGMTGGCLLFIPFYHPLHDFFQVPSEVTSVSLLIFFVSVVWKYDRKSNRYAKPKRLDFWSKVLMAQLIGHYLVNLGTAIFINPEDMISIGLHEKVGNCTEMVPVHTVLRTLQRRKYLCAIDYDEKYYDFHCLPDGKLPDEGSIWYTICGTPFENRAEYITVLSLITYVAFMVFRSFHFEYDENMESLTENEKKKLLHGNASHKEKEQ